MPDWKELVRKRLAGLELDAAEKDEVHAELASHLEESYETLVKQGAPERDAVRGVLSEVGDWRDLRRKIFLAKRRAHVMKKRTQQLWIPGFLTLILSMIFLAIFHRLGFHVRVVGSGSGALFFFAPWLLLLPFLGALGAYLSSRAGGSRAIALLASGFPVLALTGAFLSMFPIGMLIEWIGGSRLDYRLGFRVVAATLLRDGIGWLLLPGLALLAGGILVCVFFSQRSSQQNMVIGQRGMNA